MTLKNTRKSACIVDNGQLGVAVGIVNVKKTFLIFYYAKFEGSTASCTGAGIWYHGILEFNVPFDTV